MRCRLSRVTCHIGGEFSQSREARVVAAVPVLGGDKVIIYLYGYNYMIWSNNLAKLI